jgi:ribosomal protein L30E
MHERGRARKAVGELASKAKLTEAKVLAIRARRLESCTVLAKEFGVSHTAILRIWNRQVWKHI